VFAFDAADLSENIEREVSVGSRIGASAEQCAEQIRKLKRIAAERGYRLVPGHDPVIWPALTAELAADGAGPVCLITDSAPASPHRGSLAQTGLILEPEPP
jgi:glyoxylase-like metal-dependent hydrolase (beta-lactamase superfamily II)